MTSIVLVLISCVLTAAGQIAFKFGMQNFSGFEISLATLPGTIVRIAFTPSILIGFFLFLAGAFFWLFALANLELSYAVPLAGVTYILVLLGGIFLFNEAISIYKILGTLLVSAGVILISLK